MVQSQKLHIFLLYRIPLNQSCSYCLASSNEGIVPIARRRSPSFHPVDQYMCIPYTKGSQSYWLHRFLKISPLWILYTIKENTDNTDNIGFIGKRYRSYRYFRNDISIISVFRYQYIDYIAIFFRRNIDYIGIYVYIYRLYRYFQDDNRLYLYF